MRRLIKSGSPLARARAHTSAYVLAYADSHAYACILIRTYTMRARLYLASCPSRGVQSLKGPRVHRITLLFPVYHFPHSPSPSFFSFSRFISRSTLSCSVYLSSSPRRDTDADYCAEQCTLSSGPAAMQRATRIASREARK